MIGKIAIICLVLLALAAPVGDCADIPQLMNYQGRLADTAGNPLPDSTYDITFRLYDDPSAGLLQWEEGHTVATTAGVFSVLLGSIVSIPTSVFNLDSVYLELQPDGSDAVLPRSRLVMVPYAWRAFDAERVGGLLPADLEESAEIDLDIAFHAANTDAHHQKTISATELIIGTLSEDRLPQGAIDSTEMELEGIGADRIADEPGIAHSFTSLKTLGLSVTAVDSAIVTLPTGGYLLIMASGWFYKFHTAGGGDSFATVSLSTSRTVQEEDYSAKFSVLSGSPTGHNNENFAVSRVLLVPAGQTKIFLVGGIVGVPGARVEKVHLNTIYFPTAYGNVDVVTE